MKPSVTWPILFLFHFISGASLPVSLGGGFMAGARYDDLRMCVASPAGVKGGPVADIALDLRFHLDSLGAVGIRVPFMRPILFGAAFRMLQFEPECILEYTLPLRRNTGFILGSGLGASFHWGPDYLTERDSRDKDNFFAAGPYLSSLFGLRFRREGGLYRIFGIRIFYASLHSKERWRGTVLGAAFEGHIDFMEWKR